LRSSFVIVTESTTPPRPAVLLLSGGLDSTTLLAHAVNQGFLVHALSFRYGQRHEVEIRAAERVARRYGATRHLVLDIDLAALGGSALTGTGDIPKDRPLDGEGIPVTYVPGRNTIFLSYAMAWAEVLGARDLFIAVNSLDYSGYPDCRPEYVESFERMANLATRAGVEGERLVVHAPLIRMTKREIIELGTTLGVDYAETTSCYDPSADGAACGHCDACQLRLKGFAEAGLVDPARYATGVP
jgi:7-cyano-7-deazaguanine synthase